MLRTLWVAVSVLGSLAVADAGVAQTDRSRTYRTTSGCLFHMDPSHIPNDQQTFTWSGTCTSGSLITGQGTLEVTGPDVTGHVGTTRWIGRLVNGYWHGEIESYDLPEAGESLHPEDFWRPMFNMGCHVHIDDGSVLDAGCVPASSSASTPRDESAGNARSTQGATDTPSPPSSGGVRTVLNPETGAHCLTERILPIRERGYYFEHGVTITNSCNRSFRLEITEAPHNRPSHVRYTRLIEPNRSETYTCLQGKPNGQMAETAGCEGFLEYSYED